jgi:hypothetical protein
MRLATVALVALSLSAACGNAFMTQTPTLATISPAPPCAASSLIVTGTQGERLHPDELPPGFVLQGGSELELGAMNMLEYATPVYGDRPWLELGRYHTTLPLETLTGGGSQHRMATVQGKPAMLTGAAPAGPGDEVVEWNASVGVVLFVTAHNIPQSEVLEVAEHVQYAAGTEFTYPTQPKVTVTRQRALSMLPGAASSSRAVLTSFGEVDAVTHTSGPINHVPTLNPNLEVVRRVWVVWSGALNNQPLPVRGGIVVDANSGVNVADLGGVNSASLSSLSDRSQSGCQPPFGVLTRSEFRFLSPDMPGTTSMVKLVTLQILMNITEGNSIGNCELAACDPDVPVWVWIGTANDCRLLLRCGPPRGASVPQPSPIGGTWALRPIDARTGPQNTGFGGAGGRGELPPAMANLPDLAPVP